MEIKYNIFKQQIGHKKQQGKLENTLRQMKSQPSKPYVMKQKQWQEGHL